MTGRPDITSQDETVIARVRHVLGARVTAELVAETSPLYRGRLYRLGQIGSLVRIPHGTLHLLGAITMVGIAEIAGPREPSFLPELGDRWIQLQLVGQIDGLGRFERGVGSYPALDDPVHFAVPDDLRAIFPGPSNGRVCIGSLAVAPGEPATIDIEKLVTRHGLVVGSTGSGKSSSVAALLQSTIAAGLERAHVVLIDASGEYGAALGSKAAVRSVLGTGDAALDVPYWALGFEDLLRALGLTSIQGDPRRRLMEEIVSLKRDQLEVAGWDMPLSEDVTVDS
ncbi:MAG: DUF87 domain-containing protein, partial [Acidimicrobiia bacterium]